MFAFITSLFLNIKNCKEIVKKYFCRALYEKTIRKMLKNCIISVSKQINDKERVSAAMENPNLREVVSECLAPRL